LPGGRPLTGSHAAAAARFAEILDELAAARWTCSGCGLLETDRVTLHYCVGCHKVHCEQCGGPTGETPLPAHTCVNCLVERYASAGALLPMASQAAEQVRRTRLAGLARGRMMILSQVKRTSTRGSYRAGRAAFQKFAEEFHLRLLPLEPGLLMDAAVHDLSALGLDSSTVKLRVTAMYDVYDYARTRLGLRGLRNPCRDPEVILFTRVIGINYKKRSKARTAISIGVCARMLAHGWDTRTKLGLWGRMHWVLLNVGMLRTGCCLKLLVAYDITLTADGVETVNWRPESDIGVFTADDAPEDVDPRFVGTNVDADKNVRSWNRRMSYMPADVPRLGAFPVDWLTNYVLTVRPPSGGPLLAKPLKKGGFSAKPSGASADVKKAYRRACERTGAALDDSIFKLLGTHSGRKSLSQWLWEDGHCRRLIADAGGWFLKRDAVDLYFKTARHTILSMVRNVGQSLARPQRAEQ
jgi:hypothetical protein